MQSIRVAYKTDASGNNVYARVIWAQTGPPRRHIALAYHAGGLIAGSSDIIPKPQIDYLCSKGFVVIAPNYRLAPQVTAKNAFSDCEEAYDWAVKLLPGIMKAEHGIELDVTCVTAFGHSIGGTIAMHIANCKPLHAVTAFYPSLFLSDSYTSAHQPTTVPPFGTMPDYTPTDEEWSSIKPEGVQLSEAPLAVPGTIPSPRSRWQMHILKHGEWLSVVQPDGNYAALDPTTRLSTEYPPVMMVQGDADNVPGSSLELAQRAESHLKAAGVKDVQLEVVAGEGHMFDMPPTIGSADLGPRWQAVVRGLDWLTNHV